MDPQPPTTPAQVQKPFHRLSIFFAFLILLLIISIGLIVYLRKQITKPYQAQITATITPTPKVQYDTSPAELMSKVKSGGTIDKTKIVNTDSWKAVSGTATENKSINYSYQYPENLFTVPNVRPGFDALYFFENRSAYDKFVACIQDKNPVQKQGGGGPTRDWEGGCDLEGNLLFSVSVGFSNGRDTTFNNKPTDLTRYDGWGQEITWYVPQKDTMISGMYLVYYADGEIMASNEWISVRVTPSSEAKIKSITGVDSYTLFTHIIASFQIK